ncbi:MAG: hypothetical protein PHP28_03290 [Actinomycetota bacterium]|nr:hypothetical protein [Actinomycetota bacterium]MDD5667660.1 hypothetical protein [Actinomycetota bacterium]
MKKSLVIALLVLLVASVTTAAGCGGSSGGNGETAEDVVNGDSGEEAADTGTAGGGTEKKETADGEAAGSDKEEGEDPAGYSVLGTYESGEGTFITLNDDGSFESDAWGAKKEGSYKEERGGAWIRLSFGDGSSATLSVMIGDGGVSAIVDDDTLVQYNRK